MTRCFWSICAPRLSCAKSRDGLAVGKYHEYLKAAELEESGRKFGKYLFGLTQLRLVELGYWRFVEEHIDDYIEQNRVDKDAL